MSSLPPLPPWLGYTMFAVAIIAIAWAVLWARRFQAAEDALWMPLEGDGVPPGMRFRSMLHIDANRLARAQALSIRCFVESGIYSEAAVWESLKGTRILVRDSEAWLNQEGQLVSGESGVEAGCVVVGPSFETLAHEDQHLLEFKLRAVVDYGHKEWASSGALGAVLNYESRLKTL